jgi:DNA-binding response OmpR family regulator
LKEEGVNAKIVAITADENTNEVFLEAGADAFVVKPLNPAKLNNLLKDLNLIN